jgi:hypothetical protein
MKINTSKTKIMGRCGRTTERATARIDVRVLEQVT